MKFPEALIKEYQVNKVPEKIQFIFDKVFAESNKLEEFNIDLPKPYGQCVTLSREQEYELFLKFNYAKYRASEDVDCKKKKIYLTKAAYYKEVIAYHNMPLGYKWIGLLKDVDLTKEELESEVFYALNYAINKFDVSRGCKFSTFRQGEFC